MFAGGAIRFAVDYDSLTAAGAMMGLRRFAIMDEETCMVDLARFFNVYAKRILR